MFFHQLKYEFLRILRSSILWWLLLFLAVSVGFALYNGATRIEERKQSISEIISAQNNTFKVQKHEVDSIASGLKEKGNWWQDPTNVVAAMWWGGRQLAIEPESKNIIATGMSDLQPDVWQLSLLDKTGRGNSEFENPTNLSFGSFDLAFVIVYLLPLLVIGLSYNLISGEREYGTLPLQRVQPVTQEKIFFHKTLARFIILFGLTLLVLLPGILAYDISLLSTTLGGVVAVVGAYVLFWFLLVLGINLLHRSSMKNALNCIGAWLFFVLIIPSLVNMASQYVKPVPSRSGYQLALREINNEVQLKREKYLDDYYELNPNDLRVSETDLDWFDWNQCKHYYRDEYLIESIEQRKIDSIAHSYATKAQNQNAFANKLMLFSPSLSAYSQLTDLAGTSQKALRESTDALEKEQDNWKAIFEEKFKNEQDLTPSDYTTFMGFSDRIVLGKNTTPKTALFWLLLQCMLVGSWIGWRLKTN